MQVPVPEQPPPCQPANVEPEFAVAVNVTVEKGCEHRFGHEIPFGLLVTFPDPVPARTTVSLCVFFATPPPTAGAAPMTAKVAPRQSGASRTVASLRITHPPFEFAL
jgi:hypothetical protein